MWNEIILVQDLKKKTDNTPKNDKSKSYDDKEET